MPCEMMARLKRRIHESKFEASGCFVEWNT